MSIDSTLVYADCGRKTGVRKPLAAAAAAAAAATTTTTTSSSSSSSSSIIIIVIVIITITVNSGVRPLQHNLHIEVRLVMILDDSDEVSKDLRRAANNASLIELAIAVAQRDWLYPNDSGEVLRNLRRAANNASLIELAIAVAQPEPTYPSILAIVNAQGLLKALLQSHWSSLAA
ncbi:uncharacterized protein BO66DRAFT_442724 [Aspergillus aculeatinus CBS 121060]|uniref:Uncharacterized protein n=1 Tax=Aspergillus aculeatinus CBS 121060 TaxID=1448322 RepID=A0ACD1GWR1_9EURO|nr:hypothetical protein BO66DRAFT_442724 [Aspergillus aculeatinus CBS 121060]RAH65757.1 hypothetical protein BO66DRAFT_442724 [Aspergillus aculeatinus CBS 121060]